MPKVKLQTTEARSLLMSKIRGKNTKPELRLRKALYAIGLRYRVNDKKLPGTPDIVLRKYKLAIFVDGEFWHGKDWETNKVKIKSNPEFWIAKIEKNIIRDSKVGEALKALGYQVFRFWSMEVNKNLGACLKMILDTCESFDSPVYQ